jgi:hypothetical protein
VRLGPWRFASGQPREPTRVQRRAPGARLHLTSLIRHPRLF